jgi:hypothetical protein
MVYAAQQSRAESTSVWAAQTEAAGAEATAARRWRLAMHPLVAERCGERLRRPRLEATSVSVRQGELECGA